MTSIASTTDLKTAAPPGTNSDAYYVDWLQELSDLRVAGLISDEDFAFSRAERMEQLFDAPPKPWLKWLFGGIPAALVSGAVLAYLQEMPGALLLAGAVCTLCALAAVGAHSRVMSCNLSKSQKLGVLRALLARDLICSDEFSDFESRLATAR